MKRLYFGGSILTMDKSHPRAEAVLTQDGAIAAVGDYNELFCADAQPVDLQGKTLMPAFVDGHSHAITMGININKFCDLSQCLDFDQMLECIRRFREEKNLVNGESIYCRGYDLAIMKEGCHPTAAVLDRLGFDNPVACVHMSGHVSVYNTVAMEKAGVTSENFVCPQGGHAHRDRDGRLTGCFEENARSRLNPLFLSGITDEDLKQAMLCAQEHYIKHGFATVQEGSANSEQRIACLRQLDREGLLKVDVVAYLNAGNGAPELWDKVRAQSGEEGCGRFKIGGVKLFLDGSPQARTAWLSRPYEGEREYCGYPSITDQQAEERLSNAVRYGYQPLAHCNGDAACEQFLRAWERISAAQEQARALRPVMIHAQTVRYDQLERMKAVGMMPSFFVGHCYFWGDTHIRNMGERAYRISPMRKALELGLPCSIHQDSPVTPPDMLHSVWCAVNRISRNAVTVGADNRIDCYDALICATNGGAYTYFEEETKGILKPGAVADFVILDRDPTAVDPMTIKDIRVCSTIKNDRAIYTAPEQM